MKDRRRFPAPWSIRDLGAAFVVKDSARRIGDRLPSCSRNEARRSAANIAKLPELLGRGARYLDALSLHGFHHSE
jgi:hypothetical protein